MTKYREIIRLTGLGFSQRNIMASCGVSQKTVVKVQKRARELNISWPLDESMTDTELQKLMFSKESKVSASKKMPDYAYIRKELLRNGVTKKLLWTEYIEDCRANGEEPLMYSQFCYHIQQDEQKHRATMHINRKPGEQIALQPALAHVLGEHGVHHPAAVSQVLVALCQVTSLSRWKIPRRKSCFSVADSTCMLPPFCSGRALWLK